MSLVGFKAQNHPQQPVRDDVDDRRTPPDLFAAEHQRWQFTIDAAASDANAMLPRYWTRADDALAQDWGAERVWCNPPYSALFAWVEKAHHAVHDGCAHVSMLLPANRCEQRWWQTFIEPYRDGRSPASGIVVETQFLPGRLRFGWPPERVVPPKGDRPPFGCVLVRWHNPGRIRVSSK